MSKRTLSVPGVLLVVLTAVAGTALVRAAALNTKYHAEVQQLRQQWSAQQQAEGLTGGAQAKALYAKYPTPELTLAKTALVAPGGTAKVSLTGSFPAGTVFVIENDQLTLSGGAVAGNTYSATVTASPDAVPAFGRLHAFAPVSGASANVAAVFVGAPPSFEFTASNGWLIKVAPTAKQFEISGPSATVNYNADFYKPGETKPFETTTGTLSLSASNPPSDHLSFSISSAGGMAPLLQEMEAIQRQMADGAAFMKKTEKEQAAIMAKLEDIGNRMAAAQETMIADPAEMQRREDAFGCSSLNIFFAPGGGASGSVSCGKDLGTLQLTGSRK